MVHMHEGSLQSGTWNAFSSGRRRNTSLKWRLEGPYQSATQRRCPLQRGMLTRERSYKSTPEFLKNISSSNSLHAWPPSSFHTARFLPVRNNNHAGHIGGSYTAPVVVAPFSPCGIKILIWSCVSCVIVRERFKDGEGVPRHVLMLSLLTSLGSTQSSSVATLDIGESKQAVIIAG